MIGASDQFQDEEGAVDPATPNVPDAATGDWAIYLEDQEERLAHGTIRLLAVTGALDLNTRKSLIDGLEEPGSSGFAGCIIDLDRVSMIDSSALGSLLRAARRLESGGQQLAIVVRPDSAPYRLLRAMEFLDELPVFGSRGRALAAMELALWPINGQDSPPAERLMEAAGTGLDGDQKERKNKDG